MQLGDAGDDARHFLVVERRPAAQPVPGQHQLERDLRIDAVPEQMAGERGDGGVALAFGHALLHEPPPVGERAARPRRIAGKGAGKQQPARQRRRRHLGGRAPRRPGIKLSARMQ